MRNGWRRLGSRVAYWSFIATCVACLPTRAPTPESTPTRIDVRLEPDEADAALAILETRLRGATPAPAEWERVFAADGYQHLKERETAMGRPFTDSTFTAFLMSDTLLQRAPALARALPSLERLDVSAATARALAYLPSGTPLHARLYLEIKPRTNSFVFTGRDSVPSIFLYVQPDQSPAQLENTLAHELHHIGVNRACPDPSFSNTSPAQGMLLRFLGAFGEGQAMLAAAGSASIHPHAVDDDSVRTRWDHDVSHAPADIAELSRFFTGVLDGRITSADSVRKRAFTYYGIQGPWYTVGWLMASTIERELGRDKLIGSICDPTRFITVYQQAAERANRRGAALPLWDDDLVKRLQTLRLAARDDH